ncbi:MAG TPA: GNAT family N-acetyltransferase [Blastocatellia bacterium]|jgi:GNAT superfamily N-acetyltransferase|nr:GNAT family N-acetyltransferase [Blastocatellia bacterium]HAF21988.1 GNAT family N-acetyltransferase [Blastocatellia bacterium]
MSEAGAHQWQRGEYTISTDNERLDVNLIQHFIATESYWGQGRRLETVERALANSLSFGIYKNNQQVGFARVVTDYCTFAWLADVFVVDKYRGLGLSKLLLEVIMAHPALSSMRRWVLATRDAHGLYRQFGFAEMRQPERWMERFDENA